jgi:hypothetical protein
VLLVGLSLMLLTWLATTPSGTAADEPDHYVRALGSGRLLSAVGGLGRGVVPAAVCLALALAAFGDVPWDPPLGWLAWALVMPLATAAYASAIVGAHGDRSRH